MWKSEKSLEMTRLVVFTDYVEKEGRFSTAFSDRKFSTDQFSFSTELVERSALGIDVGFDLLDGLREGGFLLHLLLYLLDGIEDRRVVTVVKDLADIV